MHYLFTLLATFLVLGINAQDRFKELDDNLQRLAEDGYFSGNVLLAEGNQLLFSKSYGLADYSTKRALNKESIFELASVSKQFTATAVLLLVEDGKVDLTKPIADYLPELAHYPNVTTYHLVHHLSGLPDYMAFVDSLADRGEFVMNETVLNIFRDHQLPIDFEAGERYEYSNTGYLILASLIERVSGQSFGNFLASRIFKPLGMDNTLVYRRRFEKDKHVNNYAYGYVWDDNAYVLPDSHEEYKEIVWLDGVIGDGMVNSTIGDLWKWDRALASGKLDTATLFRSGLTNDGTPTNYGFGFQIHNHENYGKIIGHSGSWPGYNTYIYRFPDTDRTLILLRNDDGGKAGLVDILNNVRRYLFGQALILDQLQPVALKAIDVNTVKELEGTYIVSKDFKLDIFIESDALFLQATGQQALEMKQLDKEDHFTLLGVAIKIVFNRDETAQIIGLTVYQGDAEIQAQKEE